jgi:hypothetical protein
MAWNQQQKVIVGPDINLCNYYHHVFGLDPNEWCTHSYAQQIPGARYTHIVWLRSGNRVDDGAREHYITWICKLLPDGQLHILDIPTPCSTPFSQVA